MRSRVAVGSGGKGPVSLHTRLWRRPETYIFIVVLAYLSWQVLVPLVALLFSSFKGMRPSDAGFLNFDFTFKNYRALLQTGRLWKISATTVSFALGSAVLAVAMGVFLAWITTRSNAPFRKIIAFLVLSQLAIPELLVPIAWTWLLGPKVGLFNHWWTQLTGLESPLFNIYSMPGMIWVESLLLIPLVYLFAVPSLSAMDRSFEEAAEVAGASRAQVVRDVVLRLAAPGVAATFILALVRSWEAFEVPWYLGLREGTLTYATQIYFSTVTPPSNTGLISAYAVPMLAVAVLLVLWYSRFENKANRYAVMTGKNYRTEPIALSRTPRRLLGSAGLAIVVVAVLIPLLMLLWTSILPFYRPPSMKAFSSLTLDSYVRVFRSPNIVRSFLNSLIVGLAASVVILGASVLSAWISLRSDLKGRWLVNRLTFLSMSIPNIVVGICFLWIFLVLPVNLTGSYVALIVGYCTVFLAVGARNVYARMMQVHPELDEAARVSGASLFTTLRTVMVPMLGPALLAGVLYVVVWAFKELPNALLLTSASTKTAAVTMFDLSAMGTMANVSAVGVVTIVFLMILLTGFMAVARRFGLRGF